MVKKIFKKFDKKERKQWDYTDFSTYLDTMKKDTPPNVSEENFMKINRMLGKRDDLGKMELRQLIAFYSAMDRRYQSDLAADFRKISQG